MIAKFLHQIRSAWSSLSTAPATVVAPLAIVLASTAATGALLGVRHLGGLQSLELAAYDQMVRLRPDAGPDDRLLIVAITEDDLKAQRRWPLSDQTVATLLQRLQTHRPTAIGLDLYRDLPQEPGTKALAQQLRSPNVITITKLNDTQGVGIAPPPNVLPEQIGFNDVATDPDGVPRRNLMFADTGGDTLYSFSLRLALAYLKTRKIEAVPGVQNSNHLRLGQTEFMPWEPTSGPYQSLDSRGYQILLNYRARRNLARQVTLTQVLNGEIDPGWVNNKVVLIGTTAPSIKDIFLTPYSPDEAETPWMAGVEIHAQMVSQILTAALDNQPLFWFWPDWVEIIWIGLWAVIGGCFAWMFRHPLLLSVAGVGTVSILFVTGYSLFLHQGWVPVAAPALAMLTAAAIVVSYRSQQAQRQQQMMMRLLGQNTSPEIATALWRSRDRLLKSGKLQGQRLTATMVFTDIKGFSTISEQMPPEDLLEWLNEYLSAITQEVRAKQGIINKFTGDGMLAVFGVPVHRTTPVEVSHDAQQAVECALAMGDRLQQLNQDWQKRGLPVIQMRVGIFTGPVVVGSLGGKDRLEYGVIGDSVNIASRLESYEKNRQSSVCRILIAQETLDHLQDKFEVEPWGPLMLKGKQQTVDVYCVLGAASDCVISSDTQASATSQSSEAVNYPLGEPRSDRPDLNPVTAMPHN